MADTKISALTALAAADVDTAADVLPIVDTGATATKKITVDNLRTAIGPKLDTEQASTSGTSIDFTSIPAWVKKITIMLVGVSTNGSSNLLVQIGDSGGVENTNYTSGAVLTNTPTSTSSTAGFVVSSGGSSSSVRNGAVTLTLEDASDFTWVSTSIIADSTNLIVGAGSKALSAALDRVRITTVNGTDEFDAGAINCLYE
ncbi:MAG TPA: hypothetical protein VG845_13280 [Dehalococcoidia bacterium]|jgi:hypothetical protein|nr:hypothetical protein [Dehalococcoidia bacterium]